MKNADEPISPAHISFDEFDGSPFLTSQEGANLGRHTIGSLGLTKKEYASIHILSALMAASNGQSDEYLIIRAVSASEKLLEHFENPKEDGYV